MSADVKNNVMHSTSLSTFRIRHSTYCKREAQFLFHLTKAKKFSPGFHPRSGNTGNCTDNLVPCTMPEFDDCCGVSHFWL